MITNDFSLNKEFLNILYNLTVDMKSLLDVGCRDGKNTINLPPKDKLFIDVENFNSPEPFIEMNALNILDLNKTFDVITAFDFIEHLTKEDGFKFLNIAEKITNRVIIFAPQGEVWMHNKHDLDNPHTHKSSWYSHEFEKMGFQVWLEINFHPSIPAGAFLAWKSFNINEFTIEQYFKNKQKKGYLNLKCINLIK